MEEKKYEIGGRTFVQRTLVLGQWKQLLDLMKSVEIPVDAGAVAVARSLGPNLPRVLAIVLTEDGKSIRDKDLGALSDELMDLITPAMVIDIVDDFFVCNPIPSMLDRFGEMIGSIGELTAQVKAMQSTNTSAS